MAGPHSPNPTVGTDGPTDGYSPVHTADSTSPRRWSIPTSQYRQAAFPGR